MFALYAIDSHIIYSGWKFSNYGHNGDNMRNMRSYMITVITQTTLNSK